MHSNQEIPGECFFATSPVCFFRSLSGPLDKINPEPLGAGFDRLIISKDTLPETNMAPENGWLKAEVPFGSRPISKGYVSFREGMYKKMPHAPWYYID